jgi:hypothetical protein
MLTREQLEHFERNGFLLLSGAVDPEVCTHLCEQTWQRLPEHWQKDNPASWTGDVSDSCHTSDIVARRGHMKFQKLPPDPMIERGFASGSRVFTAIGELFGKPPAPVQVRGLYCIAPLQEALPRYVTPHVEAHPVQAVAVGYLDDVPTGEGGLHVWPGSHKPLYPTFASKLDYTATQATNVQLERYKRLQPVEIAGRRGDVLIMHHRLFHAPSLSRSRLRFALFCDYLSCDWRKLAQQPPTAQVWEDWNPLRDIAPSAPDFILSPRGVEKRNPDDGLSASARNKSDSSRIHRLRADGDTWISLIDDPETFHSGKLRAAGSNLTARGVRIAVNGIKVRSVCENGIISPIAPRFGLNTIAISGEAAGLGLMIIRTRLPFSRSRTLLRRSVKCAPHHAHFVDWRFFAEPRRSKPTPRPDNAPVELSDHV